MGTSLVGTVEQMFPEGHMAHEGRAQNPQPGAYRQQQRQPLLCNKTDCR
jgi:hypothetical protein